jgi:hypothetical protein
MVFLFTGLSHVRQRRLSESSNIHWGRRRSVELRRARSFTLVLLRAGKNHEVMRLTRGFSRSVELTQEGLKTLTPELRRRRKREIDLVAYRME